MEEDDVFTLANLLLAFCSDSHDGYWALGRWNGKDPFLTIDGRLYLSEEQYAALERVLAR